MRRISNLFDFLINNPKQTKTQKMRKFHEFTTKDDLRPTMQYIHCDGTYLKATDAHILAKVHFSHAFPSLTEVPEFYMHRDEWKKLFSISPDQFTFSDGQVVGINMRKGSRMIAEYMTPEQFEDKIGRYPNVGAIMREIDETASTSFIALNLDKLQQINNGLGIENPVATFSLDAPNRYAVLTFNEFRGFVILMPCVVNDPETRLNAYKEINGYSKTAQKTA